MKPFDLSVLTDWISSKQEALVDWLTFGGTLLGVVTALFIARYFLERVALPRSGGRFRMQMAMLVLSLVGVIMVVMALPSPKDEQLLNLLGVVLSAAIALSSTTFLGNAMAGVMLRAVRPFELGDFIRVDQHFGRVSERGLFHVEIQTEDRELTTLPNLFLVTHPVTTTRSSGTVVAAELSLGYDLPRGRVERLLLEAAAEAGLRDAFVQIRSLGDDSVGYRIAGLLDEVRHLLTSRSRLHGCVLDALHQDGIEIVSPRFVNLRSFGHDRAFIPRAAPAEQVDPPQAAPEEVVFDKAEEAANREAIVLALEQARQEVVSLEGQSRSPPAPEVSVDDVLEKARAERDRLAAELDALEAAEKG